MLDYSGLPLKGKTAIATGSSGGVGASIVKLLAKRGANVAIKACRRWLVDAALGLSENEEIDILIQNAAISLEKDLVHTTLDFYTQHFDCNARAPLVLTKSCIPHFPKRGRIVFISSTGARMGVAAQTVYTAIKAANESFAKIVSKGVGSNSWCKRQLCEFGHIATDQWFQSDKQFLQDMLIDSTPASTRRGGSGSHCVIGCLFMYRRCTMDNWCYNICKWWPSYVIIDEYSISRLASTFIRPA